MGMSSPAPAFIELHSLSLCIVGLIVSFRGIVQIEFEIKDATHIIKYN